MTNRIEFLWKNPKVCLIAGMSTVAGATVAFALGLGAAFYADKASAVEVRTEPVVAEAKASPAPVLVAAQPVEQPAEKPVAKAIDPAEAVKAREAFAALWTGARGAANGFQGIASDAGATAETTAVAVQSATVVAAANRDAAQVAQAQQTKQSLAKAAIELKGFGSSFAVSKSTPSKNDVVLAQLFSATARNFEQHRLAEERFAARRALVEWLVTTAVLNAPTFDAAPPKDFPIVPASAAAKSADWVKALDAVWVLPAEAANLKKAKDAFTASGISFDTAGVKYDEKAVKLSWELKGKASGEVTTASVRNLLMDVVEKVLEFSNWPAADRKKLLSDEGFVVTLVDPGTGGTGSDTTGGTVLLGSGPYSALCGVAPTCCAPPVTICAPCAPVCYDSCASAKSERWVPFSRLRKLFGRSKSSCD